MQQLHVQINVLDCPEFKRLPNGCCERWKTIHRLRFPKLFKDLLTLDGRRVQRL